MVERAQVRSVETIDAFRTHLVLYLAKARPLLEEVGGDLRKTLHWIENEQRARWERELRRRLQALEDAQQALFSARLSSLREASSAEQSEVRRARNRVEEAREKLGKIQEWSREFENRTAMLVRQMSRLDGLLSNEMNQAVAWLTEALRSLTAYAEAGSVPSVGETASVPVGGKTGGAGSEASGESRP